MRTCKLVLQTLCALSALASLSASAASLLLSNAHITDPATQQDYVGYVLIQDSHVVDVSQHAPSTFMATKSTSPENI